MKVLFKQTLICVFAFSLVSCSGKEHTESYTDEVVYRTFGKNYENYYVSIVPKKEKRGIIVLLPSFGTIPEKFLYEIKLDSIAARNKLIVMVASPQGWGTHYLDNASIDTLDQMISEVSQKYRIEEKEFVIGGISIGGTGALRYAEYYNEGNSKHNLKLMGAFVVDPPLDFERLWFSMEQTIERNTHELAVNEAKYFLDLMRNNLGGSPKDSLHNYHDISPFSAMAEGGGKAKLLIDLPIRFYTEPDTTWWKENRGSSYKDLNCYDIDGTASQLRQLGNYQIDLIKTEQKGYREDGRRHPPSWSIVDEQQLIEWISKRIGNQK